ncbi:hypothetical protein [uncultured Pelagimonas sp.]|uniref:hypothetical protein n=1 Tax=uncultured Pelagimonas sp. TaxID=1618102 RepID=UPI00262E6FCD|nr:hypothetical protein [uncultured Pelagimonas sp.]
MKVEGYLTFSRFGFSGNCTVILEAKGGERSLDTDAPRVVGISFCVEKNNICEIVYVNPGTHSLKATES